MIIPDPAVDDLKGAIAVIDTCVLAEVFTPVDLLTAMREAVAATKADPARTTVETTKVLYRRERARESLILVEYLHRQKATTFSLSDELWRLRDRHVVKGKGTEISECCRIAFCYLVPDVCRDWIRVVADEDGQPEPTGNAADDVLLEVAKRYKLPIITQEGHSHDGSFDEEKRIRKRAPAYGVQVYTPTQFWNGKINPADAMSRLMRSYNKRQDGYIAREQPDKEAARVAMQIYRNYLGYVLPAKSPGLLSP